MLCGESANKHVFSSLTRSTPDSGQFGRPTSPLHRIRCRPITSPRLPLGDVPGSRDLVRPYVSALWLRNTSTNARPLGVFLVPPLPISLHARHHQHYSHSSSVSRGTSSTNREGPSSNTTSSVSVFIDPTFLTFLLISPPPPKMSGGMTSSPSGRSTA